MAEGRRNYSIPLYLDSAPDNWLDYLESTHVPTFVSPLHDKDFNDDGTPKKPHRHIFIMFDGCKPLDYVCKLYEPFLQGKDGLNKNLVEFIESRVGYARYLCHLDCKEHDKKPIYDISELIELNGADYSLYMDKKNKFLVLTDIISFVEDNDIIFFCDLFQTATRLHQKDWLPVLCDECVCIKEYIKSRSFKRSYKHD